VNDEAQQTLDWARKTAGDHVGEEILAAQMFCPRGAWGDKPRHLKRWLFRTFGVAGGGLHPLEREMSRLNVALLSPSSVVLCPLRTGSTAFTAEPPFARFDRNGLEASWKRRKVTATLQAGDTAASHRQSKIVVATLAPPGDEPLEIDLPDTKVTRFLREELSRSG